MGVKNDKDSHATYLHWGCTATHSNKHEFGSQKYVGIDDQKQAKNLLECNIMNGTRPKFIENSILNQSYYEQPNPYVNAHLVM